MQIRLTRTPPTAAILLAGVVALGALVAVTVPWLGTPSDQAGRSATVLGGKGRIALEYCMENVALIHDEHWAVACNSNAEDDSPECTLPPDRAAVLNAARSGEEDSCMGEAVAADRAAPR